MSCWMKRARIRSQSRPTDANVVPEPTSALVFAPAKVNLTLHVTGRRADGYHTLDSLVVFADVGDRLELERADETSLLVEGPEAAAVPSGTDNLVLRAAALSDNAPKLRITLTKTLPVASGIGGGSADAAAVWRGLHALADAQPRPETDPDNTSHKLLSLGADIPMCIPSVGARVGGIGDVITHLPDLPFLPAVLINPNREVSTPSVFKEMHCRENPPMESSVPAFDTAMEMIDWLAAQRNDLEVAAIAIEPAIADVKSALRDAKGCHLSRMSGSGATCFGLFESEAAAKRAARALQEAHPDWWVVSTCLGDQGKKATPRLS